MTSSYREIIRRHSRPLQPLDTEEPSRRGSLQPIDAVLFDIYGTLLISGSGDIGGGDASARGEAVAAALQAVGVVLRGPPEMALQVWRAEIDRRHQEARQAGVDFPEVDILEVWRGALAEWTARGWTAPASGVDLAALAVEFEVRANPVWPMPGMLQTLETLRAAGKTLGVISNAQFFTRETFPALVERTLDDLGCEPDLQFYSYQHARAKPSLALYTMQSTKSHSFLTTTSARRRGVAFGRRCSPATRAVCAAARAIRSAPESSPTSLSGNYAIW
jgi:putative hydrolase of the HAD superfamily